MVVRSQLINRTVSASPLSGSKTDEVYVATETIGWSGTPKPAPLIIVHGAGFITPYMVNWDTTPNYNKMTNELAQRFTVYVSDLGGDWWGSPDHIARIEDARLYLNSTWGTSGPVTLVGFSMGGLGALNYARAYPANVRAVCLAFPVISLNRFRTDISGAMSQIDACYVGGYSDATYGSMHNPAIYAGSLSSSIPVRIHYSNTDALIPVDTITTFKADRPSTQIEMVGSNGHGDLTIADALDHIIRFCQVLA